MRVHVIQTGCLILGILCFFYYVGIVLYAGLRTSISWVWLLAAGVFLFLWRALIWQQNHPGSWIRYVTGVLGVLLVVGFIVILAIGTRVVGAMVQEPETGLDCVIVLGAQVRGAASSRALRRRLDCAVEYAQKNPETVFVLSGGQGPDERISEAECMYYYMVEHGVSKERLLLEDQSTSTKENLEFSDRLYSLKEKRVGILSNNFHIYRALALAGQEGYRMVCGVPASSDAGMQPHNILREVCCVLLELAKGNIKRL